MSKYSHDLIVIGGGAAGLTLTSGASQLGMKTLLIEKEHMGGDCLYFGCVPSKSLIRSSAIWDQFSRTKEFGLPEMGSLPKVDAVPLMKRIGSVIDSIAYHDSPERFESLGAEVIMGSPRFVSDHEIEVETNDGLKRFNAPKITISTGSRALIVPIPGLEEAGYLTNRNVFSIREIPARLTVIGAGPIGVEIGLAMANLGSSVTIITKTPQILPHEDLEMTLPVTRALERKNIKLIFNAAISEVSTSAGTKTVHYSIDDKKMKIDSEEILLSVGRTGNHEELALENAGVEVNGRYIKTDSSLRTSRKHIMAIGDINGKFLFTHVAGAEGGIAVRRQVLGLPATMSYETVPWVTYVHPEIASIGYNLKRAEKEGIRYRLLETGFSSNDRAQAEGEII